MSIRNRRCRCVDAAPGVDYYHGLMEQITVGGELFSISRAIRDDIAFLVELLSDDILGSSRETTNLGAYFAAFGDIDADPNQLLAVIRDADGDVCGTFQLTLIPGLARGGTKRLQIEAVRLGSSTRGKGLGSALFAWAHEWGRSRGAALAQLTTDKKRNDAHRFYDSLGYAATHEGYKLAL